MESVASLILNLRNGTEDESANNLEHRGAHGDDAQNKNLLINSFRLLIELNNDLQL